MWEFITSYNFGKDIHQYYINKEKKKHVCLSCNFYNEVDEYHLLYNTRPITLTDLLSIDRDIKEKYKEIIKEIFDQLVR